MVADRERCWRRGPEVGSLVTSRAIESEEPDADRGRRAIGLTGDCVAVEVVGEDVEEFGEGSWFTTRPNCPVSKWSGARCAR